MDFKAAMFDFDGTVTAKGIYFPNKPTADLLVELARKMPLAFCTGRQLESFEHHGLNELLNEIDPDYKAVFLENLYLIAENGAIGYFFDMKRGVFEEFYRVEWPSEFIEKVAFVSDVGNLISEIGEVFDPSKFFGISHRVVVVLQPFSGENTKIEDVYAASTAIYEKVRAYLTGIDPDFEKYLHVGNSGIGVVIGPANGDKDHGVREFGDYLNENRGFEFGEAFDEILLVGDSPQIGGNDHYFLSGKYGCPYTVGPYDESLPLPKPVLDLDGCRLLNDEGTRYLIKSILG
jgi:hydroxymethylpyrimidine pyrophosphatase-like HAD family hydrolase